MSARTTAWALAAAWIAAFAVGVACGNALPTGTQYVSPEDQALAQQALAAWVAEGYPAGTCASDTEIQRLRVWVSSGDDDFSAVCVKCPFTRCIEGHPPPGCVHSCAAGCYRELGGYRIMAFHRRAAQPLDKRLVYHELHHWLESCSGVHPFGDPEHLDEAIWGPQGLSRLL